MAKIYIYIKVNETRKFTNFGVLNGGLTMINLSFKERLMILLRDFLGSDEIIRF